MWRDFGLGHLAWGLPCASFGARVHGTQSARAPHSTAGFAALTGARRCGPHGLWLQAASNPAGGDTRLGSLKRGVGGTLTKMMAAGRKRPLELTKSKRGGAVGGAPRRTGRQVGGPRLSVHAWRV